MVEEHGPREMGKTFEKGRFVINSVGRKVKEQLFISD
jgi:hypothetical protein